MQHRRMMGVARINLAKKDLEFYTIGPAVGGQLRRSRPTASTATGWSRASIAISSGRSISINDESRRAPSSPGRPRMSLKTSTNGRLLYIYNAGNTIDMYDSSDLQVPPLDHARWRRHDAVLRRAARTDRP